MPERRVRLSLPPTLPAPTFPLPISSDPRFALQASRMQVAPISTLAALFPLSVPSVTALPPLSLIQVLRIRVVLPQFTQGLPTPVPLTFDDDDFLPTVEGILSKVTEWSFNEEQRDSFLEYIHSLRDKQVQNHAQAAGSLSKKNAALRASQHDHSA